MRAICSLAKAAFLTVAISYAQGSQPFPTLPEGPNACALLSRLDIADAVGIPVGEGVSRIRTGTFTRCSFAGGHGEEIANLVRRVPSREWVSEQLERMKRGVQIGTYHEVAGIGDRAFLREMQRGGAVLCVFVAEYYVQLSLVRVGELSSGGDILEKLARRTVARLQSR